MNILGGRQRRQRLFSIRRQHQAQGATRRAGQPVFQLFQRRHQRHLIAATLLTGRGNDALPVRHTFGGALAGQPHHTAPAFHRHDVAHPKLDRFLDGEIHFLASLQRLDQRYRQRRLALNFLPAAQFDLHAVAFNMLDVRRVLAATTIEQDHRRPRRHAQNPHRMTRHGLGEFNMRPRREGFSAVKTG